MSKERYIVNVEGAIFKNDRWLIIKRSDEEEHAPGLLSLVGGKVETQVIENNILEKTIKREILEEVNIKIKNDLRYLESKTFMTDQGHWVVDIVFLCKYKSGKAICHSTEEVSAVFWLTAEDIAKNHQAPIWLKQTIEKAEVMRKSLVNGL